MAKLPCDLFKLVLLIVPLFIGGKSNEINFPGDVVHNATNVTIWGIVLRVVNSSYHDPPVLVAWQLQDFAATWVYKESINLMNRSESAHLINHQFPCRVSFSTPQYQSYIMSNLKVGVLVRVLSNVGNVWYGDSCVNLGRSPGMFMNSTRLYCFRPAESLVTTELSSIEMMGVTNYPAWYEYVDQTGDLVGNYRYEVLTQMSSNMPRNYGLIGVLNTATVTMKCGNGNQLSVHVDYDKKSGSSSTPLSSDLKVKNESNITTTWRSQEPGYNYIEFNVEDNSNSKTTGLWFRTTDPASHQIEMTGAVNDKRMMYSGSVIKAHQSSLTASPEFKGFIIYNTTTGSDQSTSNFTSQQENTFEITYQERGIHDLFSIAWNKLSIEIIQVSVLVAEIFPVLNLVLKNDTFVNQVGVNFVFTLTATNGSGTTCIIDYGDLTNEEFNANFTTLLDTVKNTSDLDLAIKTDLGLQKSFTKAYNNTGDFLVKASCMNGSNTIEDNITVTAEKSITGFALAEIPAHEFGEPILVNWNMITGTDVSVEVFYNNISCCHSPPLTDQGGSCVCLIRNTSLFDSDGMVDISAQASNLVSESVDKTQVEVVEKIELNDLVLISAPSRKMSKWPLSDAYLIPVEYPGKFIASYTGGPATAIRWVIKDEESTKWEISCDVSNITSCGEIKNDSIDFEYTFPDNGMKTWVIKLILKNAVNQTEKSLTAETHVSVVLSSISSNSPIKVNTTAAITLSFDTFGIYSCIGVDLGDNSYYKYFSNDMCYDPVIRNKPYSSVVPQPYFTQTIVVQHVYQVAGTYNVTVNGSNFVSVVNDMTQVVVTEKECNNPNVTIKGITHNITEEGNVTQHHRSELLTLTTENEIFCELTPRTVIKWSVFKLNGDPRQTPIDSISITAYQLPNDTDLHSPEIVLPGRSLEYGFYEIMVRLETDGLPDVFGEDSVHVQVIQTPRLEPALVTGALYEVIYKEQATLDASATVDPDFEGLDGITFLWFCREINDTIPFHPDEFSKEPLIYVPKIDDTVQPANIHSVGCFGTGRGRLNRTGVKLEIDSTFMVEGKYYGITLMVFKDHPEFGMRNATFDVYFRVTLGLPPALATSCIKNCLSKVNPVEKLILEAKCSARCYGKLEFKWVLYYYDHLDTPEPFNLSTLHEVSADELSNMVSNPTDELSLAFKPRSLVSGRKYLLQLMAIRPSGVYGELRNTMIMNTPPYDGNCSIYPEQGASLKTNFNISCANWKDTDSPLTYEYSYEVNSITTVFFSGVTPSGKEIMTSRSLPVGDKSNGNLLKIFVKVKDSYEAATTLNFSVQVDPPDDEELNLTHIENLVSEESNQLSELIQSGNEQLAMSLAAVIASILNNIGQGNTSSEVNQTAAEIQEIKNEKDKIDEVRQSILDSLLHIETKDMSSLLQMSGTLSMVTENSDDISPNTQDMAVELLKSSANSLAGLSQEEVPFNSIQDAVGSLAGNAGQLIMASTKDASKENSTIDESSINRTKESLKILSTLHNATLLYLVVNEGPLTTSTKHITLQSEKVSLKNLGKSGNEAADCSFKLPNASVFGFADIVQDENATVPQLQPVDLKMGVFSNNPFTWDTTSKTVTSNVVSLDLEFQNDMRVSNLTEDIAISVTRDSTQFPDPESFYMKPDKVETSVAGNFKKFLKYHCFNRTSHWTAMNFEIAPEDVGLHIKVYMKTGGKPDVSSGDFNLKFDLPDFSSCNLEEASISHINQSSENETMVIDPYKHCLVHPYSLFIPNVDFNKTGEHCFAIQVIINSTEASNDDDPTSLNSRRKRSFSCDLGKRRMRRSCVIIPPPPPPPPTSSPLQVLVADNLGFDGNYFFPNQTPNYNLTMYESSCLYWDEENQTWAGHGCRVGPLTSRSSIQCFCNHLTSFGSDLVVAPNPIDFSSVFNNFGSLQDNVAVLALISTVLGFYIIGVIWARRADRRDLLMTGPTILPKPQGSYHYLITLYTGNRQGSGTTAKVFFKMNGDEDDTIPVKLWDPARPCFQRAQKNEFLVSYPGPVGQLSHIQLWHNNSGSSPSWYLSRLSVKDLQTDQQWYFVCDNWLAVECEDGKVCRILPVANDQELTNFNQLFTARAVKGLADGHLWFSIFSKPPNNRFTRVQRLSCCLCLLCCTMITSAMFYNMGGEGPSPYAVHIGSLVIDLKQFVIGLQSSIIIIPVNVALVQIFCNLRPEKRKEEKYNDKVTKHDITEENSKVKSEKNVREGKLPHWFLYVAYSICYLTSAACIFFTLLYSIQWGKKTSTEWVIAMITAFFQSIVLLQPVKVVVMAVVFAVLIRKPCDSDEEKSQVVAYEPSPNTKKKKTKKKPKNVKIYSPPDPETLLEARIKRLKEIKMNAILKEIAAFFLFLIMLMNVAYYHRTPETYLMTKTLFETFEQVDAYGVDLAAVSDVDTLWMWTRETLIPGLYATEWYNGKKLAKGYMANMVNYLVGVPRVRLLRVEEDSCSIGKYFENTIPHCYSSYSITNEETRSFDVGWEPLTTSASRKRRNVHDSMTEKEWLMLMAEKNKKWRGNYNNRQKRALDPIMSSRSGKNRRKKKRLLGSAKPKTYVINDNALLPDGKIVSCLERWRHQTTLELRGFPYWGTITMYSGSGYAANLGYDPVTAYTVISDLHSNGWIDVQTRAVFVEFTVYNANTNLFGILSALVEFPASSAAFTKIQYQVARFYLHLTFGQTLAHVMVIFFMLYFLYREARLVYKQRWSYFKGFWNWIETILVLCEFTTIILFLARLYEVDRNLLQLRENPNDYVGFQYAGSADTALCYVLGVLVFFYTLRFIRLLRFNKNFLIIGKILGRISGPILNFCLPFFFGFLAFGLFAFSVFGTELEDYSTFTMTLVTQFSMTLGDFDFEALVLVNPLLGPIYFFAFVGLNIFILMNMFLAIINDSYAEIQDEEQNTQNEYDVLEYITKMLKITFTKKSTQPNVAPKQKKRKKRKVTPHYVSFKESQRKTLLLTTNDKSLSEHGFCEKQLRDSFSEYEGCEQRLERLLNTISKVEKIDVVHENAFEAVPDDKRNDTWYRVLLFMEIISDTNDHVSKQKDDENNGPTVEV